jgi:ABC-type nitrate/sulfonate/bicarbonate transport system substrate-binding protein
MRVCLMVVVLVSLLVAACAPAGEERPRVQPAGTGGEQAQVGAGQAPPTGAQQAAGAQQPAPPQRVTIGVPGPSLSYLPVHLAWKLGYLREEGQDVEWVQVSGASIIPALLSGELDFTTILSAVGAHAGQGGPSRIVQFHAVRLQHVLSVRPEITAISQLAGRRVAVQSLGTLSAFEVRKLAEHFALPDVATIAAGGDLERIAAMEAGAVDASVASIPANLIAERRGFPTLLRISTVLEIPQAGLGTSEAHLRDHADRVERTLRASARMLPVITSQRDLVVQQIAEWVELEPADAARAYDQVADTYTPNGLPTDAQMAAYMELMYETAGVSPSVPPSQLVDFTIARRVAAQLGLPNP